jgi:polysaccharide biosynthesis/export protein
MMRRLSIIAALSACCVAATYAQEPEKQPPSAPAQSTTTIAESPAPTADTPATATAPGGAPADSAPIASTPARSVPVTRDPSTIDIAKEYLIGAEDVLDVLVWKNCPDLCRTVPVRPDGKVSLPLVNDVQAAGLTPMDLRQHLTEQLSEYIPSPEVSVIVREVHNVKVAVVGAVKMPGDYELKSPATVLELIARAQGLTEFANRDRIVVIRQTGSTTTRIAFNYGKVANGKDEDNFYVRAGDIIVVP